MPPESLVVLVRMGLLAEMAGLVALVCFRLLNGQIATAGLLAAEGRTAPAPERILLLVTALGALGAYLISALHTASVRHYAITCLPDVPSSLLNVVVGGSQGLFLVTKAVRSLQTERR